MEINDLENKQNISVSVAGLSEKLVINADEEIFFRVAERLLNRKIDSYTKKYSKQSHVRVLTLAAYDTTVSLLRYCNSINGEQLAKNLRSLDEQIDSIL